MKRPFFDGKTIYELDDEFIVKYGWYLKIYLMSYDIVFIYE